MTNKEVIELFEKRHSVREYSSEDVNKEDIETIIKCGLLAPCGMHIKDSHIYTFYKGEEKFNYLVDTLTKRMGKNPFYDAPCIILETIGTSSIAPIQDGSCAIENMLLASSLLGYGCCWINSPHSELEVKDYDKLGIPTSYKIVAGIVVGHKK